MLRQKNSTRRVTLHSAIAVLLVLGGCTPPRESDPERRGTSPETVTAPKTAASQVNAVQAEFPQPVPPLQRTVAGEYLVKFRSGTTSAEATRKLREAGLEPVREYHSVPGLHLARASGDAAGPSDVALTADSQIEYVEPNFIYRARTTPDDPAYRAGPSYLPGLGAEGAWDVTTGSDDVVIAVIDSGIDYRHEDLAANIWSNAGDCNGNKLDDDGDGYVDDCHGIDTVDDDSDPMDEAFHGTAVAGVIGAVGNNGIGIAGVAWHVRLLPCRFLNSAGEGSAADAVECLDYIALLKRRGVNIIASNNSWGYPQYSRALEDGIRAQRDLGILFVASAGNNAAQDLDVLPDYPCAQEVANVICVASGFDALDSFSSPGRATVLLGAPGNAVYSTVPGNKYEALSGSSMAAPYVSGALVLLKAQDSTRSPSTLRNLVAAGAVPMAEGAIPSITQGRLNLLNSLTCTNREVLARLRPFTGEALSRSPGDRVTIRALHVRCSAPAGEVSVSVSPSGETVTLRDDGMSPDEVAGDGMYAADWIAHGEGRYDLAFPAPANDTFVVNVDPMLKPGFPIRTMSNPAADFGIPLAVGNVAGDPQLEIAAFTSFDGPLYLWDSRGRMLSGWPRYGGSLAIGLTLGNLSGDSGILELNAQYYQSMYEYLGDGRPLAGWPMVTDIANLQSASADLDGDGLDEILGYPARRADGAPFRSDIAVPGRIDPNSGAAWPAKVADLDADGRPDMVAINTTGNGFYDGMPQWWISDAAGIRPGFPVAMPEGTLAALRPLIGDVDGDGTPNIVVESLDGVTVRSQVQVFDNRGRLLRSLHMAETARESVALADVDGDGIPEIVRVAVSEIGVQRGDGSFLPGWPRKIPGVFMAGEPAIGDVDGDGNVDIVATGFESLQSTGGRDQLLIFHADGTYLPGFPKTMSADYIGASTPVIADIDLDGRNDVIVIFARGVGLHENIFAYDLHGSGTYGPIEWAQESGDPRHAGYYETGKNLPDHAYLATQVYGAGRIKSSDRGIDCKGDCIERYAKGTQVVLTATPTPGGKFLRWRGACAAQGNPCTLPLQRFTETSADFDASLTVNVAGEGTVAADVGGIRCPGDCQESLDGRTVVTLSAVPASATGLASWSGACAGAQLTCQVFLDDAKNVGATFVSEFPLTVSKSGAGTAVITSSSGDISCGARCTANFPVNSHVKIMIAPATDTYLVSWHRTGCDDLSLSCDIALDRPMTLAPEFALRAVITARISGRGRLVVQSAGIDCNADCRQPLDLGLTILSAKPDAGWHLVRFEGGACDGVIVSPCTRVITGDFTTEVIFAEDFALNYTRAGNGAGSVASAGGEVSCAADCSVHIAPDRSITLAATPEPGSRFEGWSGACSGVASCVVTLTKTTVVTATFTGQTNGSSSSNRGGGGRLDLVALFVLTLLYVRRYRRFWPTGRFARK